MQEPKRSRIGSLVPRFWPLVVFSALTTGARAQGVTLRERLVWSDEFEQTRPDPDPANWTFETGGGGWGNGELETNCSPVTTEAPCAPDRLPNAYVGEAGMLHLLAHRTESGVWTSARLKSQGLKSFQYGRIEARIRVPSGAGVWPAFWMQGDDLREHPWPACGEIDIMEHLGKEPGLVHGSLHGTGFPAEGLTRAAALPRAENFGAAFHTFGMRWLPGEVQFYVDDPGHPYVTFRPADAPHGAVWPFDQGRFFFQLSLAIGGKWPGPPDPATRSPAEMLVDYVRVYQVTQQPADAIAQK